MKEQNPTCCQNEAKFVTISHRVSYWYCETCKNEVSVESAEQVRARLSHTKLELMADANEVPEEDLDLFKLFSGTLDMKITRPANHWPIVFSWTEPDETV